MKRKSPRLKLPVPQRARAVLLALTLVLLGGAVAYLMVGPRQPSEPRSISLTNLALRIKNHDISEIRASDAGGVATGRSGDAVSFTIERGQSILKVLANLGATPDELSRITYVVSEPPTFWFGLLATLGPLIFFAVVMLFAWRRFANRAGTRCSHLCRRTRA